LTRIRRAAKRAFLSAVFVAGIWALPGAGIAQPAAADCTNLDAVPIEFTIDYQSAIQGIFDNHCIECHEGKNPPAGLDLSAGGSWSHLIDVPSSQDAAFTRVIPAEPLNSLLFLKINCATPGVGHRMPLNRDPLSDDEQGLILDWISEGAPSATTDTIFRGEFELRG
jgi:hypothetical protein